ncbi:unnamed protein product [Adineta steineri]|uniref:Uncharacterized protein n=1 Tax=Adineta steineri TaxID=433720 RepID=A0A815D7F3_9BILA|nr:unnamed protein product [Adineta steineri]CAF3743034.1 unnamed protein product [Adineta steineri]
MSRGITVKTALCLIPPENVWDQIQSIRSIHDKAYPRWMPHINLIYPFIPESEFANMKIKLDSVFNAEGPFQIEFDQSSFQYFTQKRGECTFHLRPKQTENVIELYKKIEKVLPNYLLKDRPFEAHLTLGQTTTSRISDVFIEMKAKWKKITFTVDRICMISRENDPNDLFSIKNQVLLGESMEEDHDNTCHSNDVCSKPTILPSLSTKNYLCIIPPFEFSSHLLHLFEGTSFRPWKPFRIVLGDCEDSNLVNLQIETITKFTLNFGPRSICFNYSNSQLFLKPTDIDSLERFNINNDNNFDGRLILGELDKNDLTEVANRFTDTWKYDTNEFQIDQIHIIDSNDRFQNTFKLKTQCFS